MSDPETDSTEIEAQAFQGVEGGNRKKTRLEDFTDDDTDREQLNSELREAKAERDLFCCKVGEGIEKYGCYDLEEQIQKKYEDDDYSLRDLETLINAEFLRFELRDSTYQRDLPIEQLARILKDREDQPDPSAPLEPRMERAGIDVEQLKEDFISYGTVRNHLKDCLDVDTSQSQSITIDNGKEIFDWAHKQATGVSKTTLERLANADLIAHDDQEVRVRIDIRCPECNFSGSYTDFLDNEGCDCSS